MQCSIRVERFVPQHQQTLSLAQLEARRGPVKKLAFCHKKRSEDQSYVDLRGVLDDAVNALSERSLGKCYSNCLPLTLASEKLAIWAFRQRRNPSITADVPDPEGKETFVHWRNVRTDSGTKTQHAEISNVSAQACERSAKRRRDLVEIPDEDGPPRKRVLSNDAEDIVHHTSPAFDVARVPQSNERTRSRTSIQSQVSGQSILPLHIPYPFRLIPPNKPFRLMPSVVAHSTAYPSSPIQFSWLDPQVVQGQTPKACRRKHSSFPRALEVLEKRRNGHWVIPIGQGMPWLSSAASPSEPLWISSESDLSKETKNLDLKKRLVWSPDRLKIVWDFLMRLHEREELGGLHAACYLPFEEPMELPEHMRVYVQSHLALPCRKMLDDAGISSDIGSIFQGKNLVWVDDEVGCIIVA